MLAIITLLCLLATIAWHELGHFVVARLFGVRVQDFSLGMGKKLFTYHGKATTFNLRLIPIGGFILPDETDFLNLAPWKKAVLALAGPFFNALAIAILLLSLGVLPFAFLATMFGLYLDTIWTVVQIAASPFVGLWHMIVGAAADPIVAEKIAGARGPIGMLTETPDTKLTGMAFAYLMLLVYNVAMMLFNLIPIPPLDGGAAVLAVIEGFVGRERIEGIRKGSIIFGALFILWLLLVLTFHDIARFF